jgi:hypothetical protein
MNKAADVHPLRIKDGICFAPGGNRGDGAKGKADAEPAELREGVEGGRYWSLEDGDDGGIEAV